MPVSGEFTAVEHVPHEYAVTRRRRQIWRGGGGIVGAPGEDRPCFRCHQARAAGPRQSLKSAVLTVFIFWTVFFLLPTLYARFSLARPRFSHAAPIPEEGG